MDEQQERLWDSVAAHMDKIQCLIEADQCEEAKVAIERAQETLKVIERVYPFDEEGQAWAEEIRDMWDRLLANIHKELDTFH